MSSVFFFRGGHEAVTNNHIPLPLPQHQITAPSGSAANAFPWCSDDVHEAPTQRPCHRAPRALLGGVLGEFRVVLLQPGFVIAHRHSCITALPQ
jgi:hypothetical protein